MDAEQVKLLIRQELLHYNIGPKIVVDPVDLVAQAAAASFYAKIALLGLVGIILCFVANYGATSLTSYYSSPWTIALEKILKSIISSNNGARFCAFSILLFSLFGAVYLNMAHGIQSQIESI